jgi:hypothetical protein
MYTAFGIIGGILILFGFYRVSIGQWTGRSFWFEMDNLLGAIFIGTYQLHHQAYVSVILNVVWAVVAIRGLSSYADRRLRGSQKKK